MTRGKSLVTRTTGRNPRLMSAGLSPVQHKQMPPS